MAEPRQVASDLGGLGAAILLRLPRAPTSRAHFLFIDGGALGHLKELRDRPGWRRATSATRCNGAVFRARCSFEKDIKHPHATGG